MRIKIPHWLFRLFSRFEDWANVPLWQRGRFELRRIDLLIAAGFLFCVGWYGYGYGWQGALQGGVAFILVAMLALWFF